MSTGLKSHQYKQQMTFSDGEINLNAASLLSSFFFTEFFSFIQETTQSKENLIIMGPKKNKIKEESKKKSKKPKNVKKNHPCFSLMQLHTIFNMKMQCNLFLPHALLTCCQYQRLKYSVCPSVCTDNLIFKRKKLTHYCDLLFILLN